MKGLVEWLDDLDKAWVGVLRGEVWEPLRGWGAGGGAERSGTSMSQTERTRLRGLLVSSGNQLEDWLAKSGVKTGGLGEDSDSDDSRDWEGEGKGETEEELAGALSRLEVNVHGGFEMVFGRTLEELGELKGVGVLDPGGEVTLECS